MLTQKAKQIARAPTCESPGKKLLIFWLFPDIPELRMAAGTYSVGVLVCIQNWKAFLAPLKKQSINCGWTVGAIVVATQDCTWMGVQLLLAWKEIRIPVRVLRMKTQGFVSALHRLKAENVSDDRSNTSAETHENRLPAFPCPAHPPLPRSVLSRTPFWARWIYRFWTRQVICLMFLGPIKYSFAWNICPLSGRVLHICGCTQGGKIVCPGLTLHKRVDIDKMASDHCLAAKNKEQFSTRWYTVDEPPLYRSSNACKTRRVRPPQWISHVRASDKRTFKRPVYDALDFTGKACLLGDESCWHLGLPNPVRAAPLCALTRPAACMSFVWN